MTTICLLTAIFLDRLFPRLEEFRRFGWLTRYADFVRSLLPDSLRTDHPRQLLILFTPLLALVAFIQGIFSDSVTGFGSFLFATAALFYALGPQDIDREVTRYWEADNDDDRAEQLEITQSLLQDSVPDTEVAQESAIADAILWQANNRFFAVVFWFILLGPFGAIFYRLTAQTVQASTDGMAWGNAINATANRLLEILDWLPARITAGLYAISGSLEESVEHWKHLFDTHAGKPTPREILVAVGHGALRQDVRSPAATMDASLALAWRAAVFLLAALTLVTLVSWAT